MTDEEIYLKVREHFSNPDNPWGYAMIQRTPMDEPFGQCVYRGPKGEKCSIGVCLADGDYKPEMEGRSVAYLTHDEGLFKGNDEGFLYAMQDAHDRCATAVTNRDYPDSLARQHFIGWLDGQAEVRGWNVPV